MLWQECDIVLEMQGSASKVMGEKMMQSFLFVEIQITRLEL